jgi:hypothetical protein
LTPPYAPRALDRLEAVVQNLVVEVLQVEEALLEAEAVQPSELASCRAVEECCPRDNLSKQALL